MKLLDLLMVYKPTEIASLTMSDTGDILGVTFLHSKPATPQDSDAKPPAGEKPARLRASSPESLVNGLPLYAQD